ncbi:hypothetical protein FRC12_002374 [Ceratobasidium sp. 428]|nr:hypothetical protein FRC12_002374 [Ceratobasidium sp. 428]
MTSQRRTICSSPLQVPELCHTICSFLEKKHYVNLLYLSRSLYDCVLPLVWGDVDLQFILFLIPGSKVSESASSNWEHSYRVFDFPATIDLSRLNFHSNFVMTLRTASSYAVHLPDECLNSKMRTESPPLLPNLKYFIVNTFGKAKSEHVKWVPWLLHPGLLGFEMYSLKAENREGGTQEIHSWLDSETCLGLLDQLSRTCSGLKILRLYPAEFKGASEAQRAFAYKKIGDLTHLRSLTLGGTVLQNELFRVLSQLPYLETLSFRADESQAQENYDEAINIPEDSFPSLRHLNLYQLNESPMSRLCKVPQLFRHLTSAVIVFEGKPHYSGRLVVYRVNRSEVSITSLGANSPSIERLTLLPDGDCTSCFEVSWSAINAFKFMPLRYLSVGSVKLGFGSGSGDPQNREPVWEDLLAAVPQLEELRMETKRMTVDELQLLGSLLPKLRLLVFWQIDLSAVGQPPEMIKATQSITLRSWSFFGSRLRSFGIRHGSWLPRIPESQSSICDAARFAL